ncbi:Holliday junction DNA helicase subunit RuvA [Raineyella antarctica]|uniref:Holliday junction branch migration complex subunit RuvA n=1 Tax=Raineyella antarctica TaxID=1577474 RepID=A0A1G6GT63_9ACTN|nr:Holliday junction branch migration protein RuvA [Raineyella antarctica]SDB85134.1 Holliday junction DNA helicase subunit RuvA [Raineyella antarctica]
MIAHLTGTVSAIRATTAVIDLGGLGLEVQCTARALAGLRLGERGHLETSLQMRQETFTLFGFVDPTEREAFEMLLGVNAVGPKLALAVLSLFDPPAFVAAILAEDLAALTRVPGVGKKSAERMLVELKDKVVRLGVDPVGHRPSVPADERPLWRQQVAGGLQGLGWSAKEAELACDAVEPLVVEDPSIGVAQLMRAALQSLAK